MRLDDILQAAIKEKQRTAVIPFANDPNIIKCIASAIEKKIANFILIGNKSDIIKLADAQGVNVSSAEFILEKEPYEACNHAARLVRDREAQFMIKGLVQSATFLSAILNKENNLILSGKLISCAAVFELPTYHKLFVLTDPGINISPNLEKKVEIIRNAIKISRLIGVVRPKIACIETIEKVTDRLPGTIDAKALVAMSRNNVFGDVEMDGPVGFDVAISKKAAGIKGIKSNVTGDPDILMLPGILSANVLYKSFVWCAEGRVASIIVGAKVPIVLTSRSDSEEAKLLSVALAILCI